jgi:hypothetical protein
MQVIEKNGRLLFIYTKYLLGKYIAHYEERE